MDPESQNNPEKTTTEEPVHVAAPKKPRRFHKKQIILLAIGLFLVASVIGYFILGREKAAAPSTSEQSMETTKTDEATIVAEDTETEKQLKRLAEPTTGETWYKEPKELPLLGYFDTSYEKETAEWVKYFEVGTRGTAMIIKARVYNAGETNYLFEKSDTGKVSLVLHPNANATYSSQYDKMGEDFSPNITINATQHYDSLSVPAELSLENSEALILPEWPTVGNSLPTNASGVKTTLIKTFGGSKLVKYEKTYADTKLTAISYRVLTPVATEITMTYIPISEDFSGMVWDNGTNVSGKFGGIVRGCGSGVSVSRGDELTKQDLVPAGKTAKGQQLYHFKDPNNTILQKAYQETKEYYVGADAKKANMTIDEFIKNHAVFVYESPNNGLLVYTSDDYAPIGGCAKPVVYLYPSIPQMVNVKVGANVKISDPAYNPATGWNAFAWPSGSLNIEGKIYGSLFWEGPGHGEYPAITSGTVVRRQDAAMTIEKQLAEQGLNKTEISDFMVYWGTKIPNKPYVRLTWFNTEELNKLAPLTVTPKPDTVLRVFLDMAGYDYPVSIPRQTLSAQKRSGFTLVEWGGLSRVKLY